MKTFFNGDTRERKYNQTAVEWLEDILWSGKDFDLNEVFNQAKEMEEEQRKQDIINAWNSAAGGDDFHTGEDYYINL